MDEQGCLVLTSHNMYVDNNIIAEINPRMLQEMSASIEAFFILIENSEPTIHRTEVFVGTFLAATCFFEKMFT